MGAFQMDEQQGDSGRRNARNARRLPKRFGSMRTQFLLDLDRQAAHAPIVEPGRQGQQILLDPARDLDVLPRLYIPDI